MQNHIDNKWDRHVMIVNKREDGNSYYVRSDNGKPYIRGRRFLMKSLNCDQSDVKELNPQVSNSAAEKKPEEETGPGRPRAKEEPGRQNQK